MIQDKQEYPKARKVEAMSALPTLLVIVRADFAIHPLAASLPTTPTLAARCSPLRPLLGEPSTRHRSPP